MIIESLLSLAPTPVPLTVGGHTFRMVPVRGGIFRMGDEVGDLWDPCRPVHEVRLSDFWMGQFLVTQGLWKAVSLTPGPSPPERGVALDPAPSFLKGDRRPVEQVSWEDTQVFLKKLNLLLPGWNFRLPTEAEWEYAARGLTPGPSPEERGGALYSGSDRLETVAWWDENSQKETKPVGLKPPNALGLYDMSGNVWEWCADWFDGEFYEKCAAKGAVMDPRNDEVGSLRVLRGGSWNFNDPQSCRVADRNYFDPTNRYYYSGFRLAASPSSSVALAGR